MDYNGISFDLDPSNLPGGAVAKMVVSAVNSATEPQGVHVELKESSVEVSGDVYTRQVVMSVGSSERMYPTIWLIGLYPF